MYKQDPVSPQQTKLYEQIVQKGQQINKLFKSLNLTQKNMEQRLQQIKKNQSNNNNTTTTTNNQYKQLSINNIQDQQYQKKKKYFLASGNYNSRGQLVLTNQQIHKRYQNSFYGFKWMQLPFCYRNVKKKCQFWIGSSFVLTYTYALYKKISSDGKINKLPWQFYAKSYFVISLSLCTATLIQSLLTDPHCDINSQHYNKDISRLSLAKQLRKQIQKSMV